jgi:hypothetical protein
MGWLRIASSWLGVATLASGCSAGVLDSHGGGAFGTATAASGTTTGSDETPAGSSSGAAQGEGEGEEVGDTAPADSSGNEASSAVTEASESAPAMCGDDTREGDEVCDGSDLGTASCTDFGFEDGVLACDPACSLITDACFTCGDGEVALGEACDGSELGGDSCVSLGFGGGTLACAADCSVIDDSDCTPLPSCGDGLLNGGEQCDGALLGGASCTSQGFDLGELDCSGSCIWDTSGCMDDLSDCGMMGDFCLFDEDDLQSTCCPAGVGGNMFGLCNVFVCV